MSGLAQKGAASTQDPLQRGTIGELASGLTRRTQAMELSSFNLASVLLVISGVFFGATLFFGTKGGYYDTDKYDGNGTAH